MNALAEKYGDKVAILGYPCNQFGHQTNEDNAEFLNTLKYVRPGGNFEPAPTITIMEKGDVNGENAQPVWEWLRTELPLPCDEPIDTKSNGVNNRDALVLPCGHRYCADEAFAILIPPPFKCREIRLILHMFCHA